MTASLHRLAIVGFVALASPACSDVTELRVSIDVDPSLLTRERVLEVIAFDEDGLETYRSELLVGGASDVPIPAGVRVVPRSDPSRVALRFVLRGGPSDVLVERHLWVGFALGEIREIDVRLDAACQGVACAAESTCACAEAGCEAPACVPYGRCDAPRVCEGGGQQRCLFGALAPSCTVEGG